MCVFDKWENEKSNSIQTVSYEWIAKQKHKTKQQQKLRYFHRNGINRDRINRSMFYTDVLIKLEEK